MTRKVEPSQIVFAVPLVTAGILWLQSVWCDRVIEHAKATTQQDERTTPTPDGSRIEATNDYAVIWQAPFGPTPVPVADETDDVNANKKRPRPSREFGGTLVGIIASQDLHRAVFHTGDGVEVLATGEAIYGATLTGITLSGVFLLHDGATVNLPLEEKR